MGKLLPCASAPSDEILCRGRVEHGVVVQYARIDLLDHVVRVLRLDEDFDFDGLLFASRKSRRAAWNDGSPAATGPAAAKTAARAARPPAARRAEKRGNLDGCQATVESRRSEILRRRPKIEFAERFQALRKRLHRLDRGEFLDGLF